jgi:glucosyl-dolichyl phosphate glucuronosyltransferase
MVDLSIAICTWNNAEQLRITLDSLAKCEIREGLRWEIVLVNNNCNDHTDSVVESFKERLPLIPLHEPKQGLSQARNRALSSAHGALIIFTDDDVKPNSGWIKAYWRAYLENRSGFYFGGPIRSDYESHGFDHRLLEVAPLCVRGFDLGESPKVVNDEYFLGANWACPIEALRKVGEFDVSRGLNPESGKVKTGEETELMMRLQEAGWKGLYLPDAHLLHYVPARKCTLKHIASRMEAYGYELASKYSKGTDARLLFGIPRWMYRSALKYYVRYISRRMRCAPWYKEYTSFIQYIGFMKGVRHNLAQHE